jgi:hypothetical protein
MVAENESLPRSVRSILSLMRRRSVLMIALAATRVDALDRYSPSDGFPKLHIVSVTVPHDRSKELTISAEFRAGGKSPMALSQEQFSIYIYTGSEEVEQFQCDALFPAGAGRIFTAAPGEKIDLTMTTSAHRFGVHQRWNALPPGKYLLRIQINSGKRAEFDYQFLGSSPSEEVRLVLK